MGAFEWPSVDSRLLYFNTSRPDVDFPTDRMTASGWVLPTTAGARATAFQRTAGIQYQVAVGSVRVGNERSPRLAIADSRNGWIDARRGHR
jgi:hypothetical protein